MKQQQKKITKDLIRKYYGPQAKIRGFGGHYRVKTPTGGEVLVRPNEIKILVGLDDVYRAAIRLAGECWGGARAANGSREFMLGCMLHGEAEGVNVYASFKDEWAGFRRFVVFVLIMLVGYAMGLEEVWPGIVFVGSIAACVWGLMKRAATREERRKAEELGFHYPRVHGQSRSASREDAARQGWV